MNNNRTLALLSTLSPTESTALGKYLQSPFFTRKAPLYPLFLALREGGSNALKHPERTFERVFNNDTTTGGGQPENRDKTTSTPKPKPAERPFNDRAWSNALSDLNLCIEDFLVVTHARADPDICRRATIQAFHARENESLFQLSLGDVLKTQPGAGDKKETTEAWHLRFWARKQAYTYPLANRFKLAPDALDELDADVDTYYYISKLQIACNRVTAAHIYKQGYDPEQIRQLLARAAAADPREKSALLTLYRTLLSLLSDDEHVPFETFFKTLENRRTALDRPELESLVRLGLSYCVRRYRGGSPDALDLYCQLHIWADELEVWTGVVSEELLLNNGIMLAKSNNLDLLDNFLARVKQMLPDDRREDAERLLLASRQYHLGEFNAAIDSLDGISTRFPRYRLHYHSLLIRSLYGKRVDEEADSEELERALDNFSDFLKGQQQFAAPFRQSYLEMIWFVRQLLKAQYPIRKFQNTLRTELDNRQPTLRDWIDKMIGKLTG